MLFRSDRELLSEVIPCSFSLAVLSTPDLKAGDVCTIMIDDVQEQITIDNSKGSGLDAGGRFGGGMRGGGNRGEMPDGQEHRNNQPFEEREGRAGQSQDTERPERPEDVVPAGRMLEPPDGADMPDGMEPPGGMEFSDNQRMSDTEGIHNGGRQQLQEKEDQTMIPALLGISVLVLLTGLFTAWKYAK